MDTPVRGQLGVEGCGQQRPLPHRDDPTGALLGAQDGDVPAILLHPGGPDKDRSQRPGVVCAQAGQRDVVLKLVDLTTEGIPAHDHVDPAEGLLAGHAVGEPIG